MTRGTLVVLLSSCALVVGACSHAPKPSGGIETTETGKASYYGSEFEGRRTASGERYEADELTAAHNTLPFGTRIRVVNLENDKDVEVVINDRGPHKKGRIVDLSYRAAREIDMIRAGVVRVRLEVLAAPRGNAR
jgi:rare lipoprotein A